MKTNEQYNKWVEYALGLAEDLPISLVSNLRLVMTDYVRTNDVGSYITL